MDGEQGVLGGAETHRNGDENPSAMGGAALFREFREYRGEMKERWEVIYSAITMEFRRTIKNKWVIIMMIFAWLWGILPSIAMTLILITTRRTDRASIFDAGTFFEFYSFMFFFIVLFTGYIAARNVTAQKADRSITLYLCRPITKIDYLLIKFSVLALILATVTILPDILLFLITLGLLKMSFMWNIEHLWIIGSILLYGAIIVSVYALMGLAIAISTKKMPWAIAGIYIFLFLTVGLAFTMRIILDSDYLILISPWDNLTQVGAPLFGQRLPYSLPWPLSFAVLAGFVGVSIALLVYNINRVEVVG